jgi:hypothetical protein
MNAVANQQSVDWGIRFSTTWCRVTGLPVPRRFDIA